MTPRRPAPEHYLHGAPGSRVVPTPQGAIDVLYRSGALQRARERTRGMDAETDAVLVAMMLAAREVPPHAEVGTIRAPRSEPVGDSEEWFSTREVAARLRVGHRAVTRAIAEQRLEATKDSEGRWWIHHQALEQYERERRRGRCHA